MNTPPIAGVTTKYWYRNDRQDAEEVAAGLPAG